MKEREQTTKKSHRLTIFLVAVLLLATAAIAVLGIVSGNSSINAFLASRISSSLSSGPGYQVRIETLSGYFPFDLHADRITVSDPQGAWIVAENVVFRMSGWALLRLKLEIREIGAGTITLHRLPPEEEKARAGEMSPVSLPKSLPGLTIERLAVEKLVLEKEAFGQRGIFQIEGSYGNIAGNPGREAVLHVKGGGAGPPTVADLDVKFLGDPPQSLAVDIAFHESPNGWLSSVLKLENASGIDCTLQGEGPLDAWQGNLEGNVQGTGNVQSRVSLSLMEKIGLNLDGKVTPAATVVSAELVSLLEKETLFAIKVNIDPERSARVESAEVGGPGFQVRLTAGLEFPSRRIEGNWRLTVEDLAALQGLAQSPLSGSLTAQGEIAGTWNRPQSTAFVQICSLETSAVQVEEVDGNFRIEPRKPGDSALSGFQLSGTGSVAEMKSLTARPLPERSFGWALVADIPFSGPVSLANLQLDGKSIRATLSGEFDPDEQVATVGGVLHVKDIGPLAETIGKNLTGGTATVDVRLSGNLGTRTAEGTVKGQLTGGSDLPASVRPLLEPKLSFSVQGNLGRGTQLSLSRIEAESSAFRLTGKGDWNTAAKAVHGSWQLVVPELKTLRELLKQPVSGRLVSEGSLDGPFNAFTIKSTLESDTLEFDGSRTGQVRASFRASNIPDAPKGDFQASVRRDGEEMKSSTNFAVKGKTLSLSSINFQAPGNKMTGNLDIDTAQFLATGRIDGEFTRLASIGRLAGKPLSGNGKFNARFTGGRQGQEVQLNLQGKNIEAGFGSVGSLSFDATVSDLWREPRGKANGELKALRAADVTLDTVRFDASGNGKQATFTASVAGSARQSFHAQTKGTLALSEKTRRVQIASLDGKIGEIPLKLLQPVTVEGLNEGFSLSGLALAFGTGRIEASGSFDRRQIAMNAGFRQLPLSTVAAFGGPKLSGEAAGSLQVQGSATRPSAKTHLEFSNLRLQDAETADIPASTLTADGTLEGGRLNGTVELRDVVKHPVKGTFSLPVNFSVAPFAYSLPPGEPVQGRLEASADLKTLSTFFPQDQNMLTGLVNVDIGLGGTVAHPELTGTATVENGTYHNLQSGTDLRGIAARLNARGARVEIESFEASDGQKGKVTASGWVSADPARDFPLQMVLQVSNAALLRRTDATATLSGEVTVSGTLRHMAMNGNLTLDAGEISIPKNMPGRMPTIPVTEINGPEVSEKAGKADKSKTRPAAARTVRPSDEDAFELHMDVKVKVPGKLYVRGRGLNSEWKGDLAAAGSVSAPSVTGNMTVVRGTMNLFDQRFKVTEGTIQFYGDNPPSPYLNITAEAQTRDVTVRVIVTGFARDPKFDFQSDPQLPPDEILAQALFKRSLSDLTPMQAIKLAQAMNALSGRGELFNPLEKTRKLLGLDQLDIRDVDTVEGKQSKSQTGTAVGIEKYLTEDIYVDVQKGLGDDTGKVSVEVELTPHVTVEGNVGFGSTQKGQEGTGLGINWKFDY